MKKLNKAFDAANRAMRREAAVLQTQGVNINPHDLNNAEMSLHCVFMDAEIRKETAFQSHPNKNLIRAYNYGIEEGIRSMETV